MFYAVLGWICILISLGSMFARERVWRIYAWNKRRKGFTCTRTEHWDLRVSFLGMLGLLAGIILILFSLGA
ncbi:MAG: hypothetical protein JXB38_09900 [Anaerolineales bacterium]|nr:hypothetical protein [Anaerolineales bacterium]